MKLRHSFAIALGLLFVSSVVIATTYKPFRSSGGMQMVPETTWGGTDGSVGIYVRNDAGVVYHKADNTETVLGSGGGGGGGTFATTYTNTPSDNLVTENVTGGELVLKYDGIGTAQTSGLTVKSTTAATSGNQKNSPLVEQCGAGWGTGGAASQAVCGGWQLTPTQASNATADMSLYQQNGGGSLTQSLKIVSGLTNSASSPCQTLS